MRSENVRWLQPSDARRGLMRRCHICYALALDYPGFLLHALKHNQEFGIQLLSARKTLND